MHTYDEAVVELSLLVEEDVGAGGHVGWDEDVAPILGPPRVALVVVRRRRRRRLLCALPIVFPHSCSGRRQLVPPLQLRPSPSPSPSKEDEDGDDDVI